jgi:hypothetical protein
MWCEKRKGSTKDESVGVVVVTVKDVAMQVDKRGRDVLGAKRAAHKIVLDLGDLEYRVTVVVIARRDRPSERSSGHCHHRLGLAAVFRFGNGSGLVCIPHRPSWGSRDITSIDDEEKISPAS